MTTRVILCIYALSCLTISPLKPLGHKNSQYVHVDLRSNLVIRKQGLLRNENTKFLHYRVDPKFFLYKVDPFLGANSSRIE